MKQNIKVHMEGGVDLSYRCLINLIGAGARLSHSLASVAVDDAIITLTREKVTAAGATHWMDPKCLPGTGALFFWLIQRQEPML